VYLTLKKEAPRVMNEKGDVDPSEVNLPGQVMLRVSGARGGLLRIQPRVGYPPMLAAEAPESGYQREMVIDRKRLREMQKAEKNRVIEGREYFFFQSNGRFGKGNIAWTERAEKDQKAPVPLRFTWELWMNREAGNRDLRGPGDGGKAAG
jgi:hypothetical protein